MHALWVSGRYVHDLRELGVCGDVVPESGSWGPVPANWRPDGEGAGGELGTGCSCGCGDDLLCESGVVEEVWEGSSGEE